VRRAVHGGSQSRSRPHVGEGVVRNQCSRYILGCRHTIDDATVDFEDLRSTVQITARTGGRYPNPESIRTVLPHRLA